MEVIVRSADHGDVAALCHIGAETFSLACPPSTPADDLAAYIAMELGADRFEEHLASAATSIFVAELDQAVVGYLMLRRDSTPPVITARSALELQRLYVLAHYHGSGVAAALTGQAKQVARVEGFKGLWLSVSKYNNRALRFYQKHGFTVVGEQLFTVGSQLHEDLVMTCRI